MKIISVKLEDSIYEELGAMLDAMGQTKQTFYETFTITALREKHSIHYQGTIARYTHKS